MKNWKYGEKKWEEYKEVKENIVAQSTRNN